VRGRWIVNSHPKSGTHLVRNIMLHMNSDAVHQEILFYDKYLDATRPGDEPRIYITHLPYAAVSVNGEVGGLNAILLLRHPGAIALALARAFYDVNTTRPDHLYLRENTEFPEIVAKVVRGYACEGLRFGPIERSLTEMAVEWRRAALFTLRFEEIIDALGSSDAQLLDYFRPLLAGVFETVPLDAAARIRTAAEPEISATYSRNNTSEYDKYRPDDVYSMVPRAAATRLRAAATALGY
jgi:hypothetical protein